MMPDRILITGGAGFVGKRLCLKALEGNIRLRVFDSSAERLRFAEGMGAEIFRGDITRYEQVSAAVKGVRAVCHLVAAHEHMPLETHLRITFGGARNLLRACEEHRVRRFLYVSSLKAARDYPGFYGTTKRKTEAMLKEGDLDLTIFRPGLLYGPGEVRLRRIGELIQRWHVVPVIGDGSYVIYPILVDDLAGAMLKALDLPESVGKTYDMGGPHALTYDQLLDCLIERLGVKAAKIHVPIGLCALIARCAQAISTHPIIFMDQVLAQTAHVKCDIDPARADLGFNPVDLPAGLATYSPEASATA